MKVFRSAWSSKPNRAPARPALRTFNEVAEALGISPAKLTRCMALYQPHPTAALVTPKLKKYYHLAEFKTWWETRVLKSKIV